MAEKFTDYFDKVPVFTSMAGKLWRIGTVIGGEINGSTAAILTYALGKTYISVLKMIIERKRDVTKITDSKNKTKLKQMFERKIKIGKI